MPALERQAVEHFHLLRREFQTPQQSRITGAAQRKHHGEGEQSQKNHRCPPSPAALPQRAPGEQGQAGDGNIEQDDALHSKAEGAEEREQPVEQDEDVKHDNIENIQGTQRQNGNGYFLDPAGRGIPGFQGTPHIFTPVNRMSSTGSRRYDASKTTSAATASGNDRSLLASSTTNTPRIMGAPITIQAHIKDRETTLTQRFIFR